MRLSIPFLVALLGGFIFTANVSAQDRGHWWSPRTVPTEESDEADRSRIRHRDHDDRNAVVRGRRPNRRGGNVRRRGHDRRNNSHTRRGGPTHQRQKGKNGKGPAFCRSGNGHPVLGRRWCVEKGFGLGGGHSFSRPLRMRRQWGLEDMPLRHPPRHSHGRILSPRIVKSVLPRGAYRLFDSKRRRIGSRAPIVGRWLTTDRHGHVLQLRSGSLPLAELADVNGDGRVDRALVLSFR